MDDGEGNSREKDKIKEIELPPRPPPPGLLPSLDCTPEMMRLMIMKQDISSSLNNIIISLRSPYTRQELKLPVRNTLCPCLWDMEELMKEQIYDEQKGEETSQQLVLCYFCKQSQMEQGSGRRFLERFFVDKELAMYIGRAHRIYKDYENSFARPDEAMDMMRGVVSDILLQKEPPNDKGPTNDKELAEGKEPKQFKYGQIKIEDIGGKVAKYILKLKDGTQLTYLLKDDRRSFADYKLNSHNNLNSLNSYVSLSTTLNLLEKQLNYKVNVIKKWAKITGNSKYFSNEVLEIGMLEAIEPLMRAGDEKEFTFVFNHEEIKRKHRILFGKKKDENENKSKQLIVHMLIPFKAAYFKSKLVRNKWKDLPKVPDVPFIQPPAKKSEEEEPEQVAQQKPPMKKQNSQVSENQGSRLVEGSRQDDKGNSKSVIGRPSQKKYVSIPFEGSVDRALFIKDKKSERVFVINGEEYADGKSTPICFYVLLRLHGVRLARNLDIGQLDSLPEEYNNPIGAAGTIHNQVLYVFGGNVNGSPSKLAYKLDLSKAEWVNADKLKNENKWKSIEQIPKPRQNHSCFVHKDRIYVVGGTKKVDQIVTGQRKQVEVLETDVLVYDIDAQKWLKPVPIPKLAKHLSLERFLVGKLSDSEYTFLHGGQQLACVFDADKMDCYTGGQNIIAGIQDLYATVEPYIPPKDKTQIQRQPSENDRNAPEENKKLPLLPIRPRQIFDTYVEPVYGLFYLMMRSRDSYLRVMYGNQRDFKTIVVDPDAASQCKNISEKIMQTAGRRGPQDLNGSNSSITSYGQE